MYPGTFAATTPDRPAVVMSDTGEAVTYAELEERSTRLANVLRGAGLQRGDDVALLAENGREYYVVFWAAMRSGLYITAINHHLTPREVAYIVNDCGARAIVVGATQRETATALVDQTADVTLRLAFGGRVEGHDEYEAALAGASATPAEDQPRGRDMLYSSGTTGRPKGVKAPLPDHEVPEGGDPLRPLFGKLYEFTDEAVYLSPAPLYHAAPLRFGGMIHEVGGTVVVMPRFDAEAALAAIDQHGATHSQWVPTMFVRMLKLPDEVRQRYDVSSMRYAVHAAAPCPIDVKRRMIEWWGPVLHEYYAATEAIGVTIIDSHQWLEHPGSVGQSVLGTIRVCGEHGEELPPGEVGLVYFEREQMPFTYHNDPDKTRQAQHPEHDSWSTTGDVGYVDDDGWLYLTDRKAFTIISGGVNIYPQEIEAELTLHPAVHDLAVVGIPDEDMGEQVRAVVVPADDVEPGPALAEELLAHLRENLAAYKVPRSVEFVDQVPRTATGKLQKHRLRDRYTNRGATR